MTDRTNVNIATSLTALSHPRRMAVFRLLAAQPKAEMPFQSIQAATKLRTTPLVHHLREMEKAWLITRQRKGKETYYQLTPESLMTSMDSLFEILNMRYRRAPGLSAAA
ncbi:ArsR/SmtB family transcription factor [Aliiroseovarius crassostreae]|uniref:ArsR/SmtB family transcription factor n=1 Tax=Aliiroseovarius crassostreae TaxID=154981 RepID=UPI003C7CF297